MTPARAPLLLCLTALAACDVANLSSATSSTAHAQSAPARQARAAPRPAPPQPAPPAQPAQPAQQTATPWPFEAYARAWCLPDQLAFTQYLVRWRQRRVRLPEGDAQPAVDRYLPGQRQFARDAVTDDDRRRLDAWHAEAPRSHVMDCALSIAPTERTDAFTPSSAYTVYLPADYLAAPERPRPILVLVSGGNGNRTRWFLTPTRSDGMTPGTGGLELRRRVDAWAAAHPGAATPIVVGLDGTSHQFPNGMDAFLQRELPEHLLATYLPGHARGRVPLGVDCISSGCAEAMRALHADPGAFHTLGLLSPYVHPSGIDMATSFGPAAARDRFFADLAARHRAGTFELVTRLGNLDSHLPRVRVLHRALVDAGMFPSQEVPEYSDCEMPRARPHSSHCVAAVPGLVLYPNAAHHYRALVPAFPAQLAWQLDALSAMLPRLARATR